MDTREYWLERLLEIVTPPVEALAERRLQRDMPMAYRPREGAWPRSETAVLEVLGRCVQGMAPWLAAEGLTPAEEALRAQYAALTREAIAAAVDPASPDYGNFGGRDQSLVDAGFLAEGLLRAPGVLWQPLPGETKARLLAALRATRRIQPYPTNWLLFSAMVETFFRLVGEDWDPMRVDYALRQLDAWYLGDGVYGDGPHYRHDYYNSYVIQPMLTDILDTMAEAEPARWPGFRERQLPRVARYASQLERLIMPDGRYPVFGRSSAYRYGCFHALAQTALLDRLEPGLPPAQVRCGLTAVLEAVTAAQPFDSRGWLRIGVAGAQPGLGETYICTASLYLCTAVFLPLGLSPAHAFWSGADRPWSMARLWQGGDMEAEHSYEG